MIIAFKIVMDKAGRHSSPSHPRLKMRILYMYMRVCFLSDLFSLLSYFISGVLFYESCLGCQLCMGHTVDKDLLSLIQREVRGIIADLAGHDARVDAVETKLEQDEEASREEIDKILERLVSMEKTLSKELLRRFEGVEQRVEVVEQRVEGVEQRVEGVEQRVEGVEHRVEGVEQGLAETNIKVQVHGKRVEESLTAANFKVEELGQGMAELQDSLTKTVEQLAHEIKCQRLEDVKPG